MDGQIPTTPNTVQTQQTPSGSLTSSPIPQNETPKEKRSPVPNGTGRGLLFEIIFVVIVLILVFGILNYFNIIKLSELFPNYLGFLPRRDVPTGTSQQSQQFNNSTIKQLKISCPSTKEFCERGQGIIKDGKYIGWGNVLASGSAIFAAFDGNLTATKSAAEGGFKTVNLDNPTLNHRAIYFFRGPKEKIKRGPVFKGQQIAEVGGKTISIYDNSSLVFSLIPGYPAANAPAILNKEDFE